MIAQITGILNHLSLTSAVISVSGIGYKVYVTSSTIEKLTHQMGGEVSVWTHHVIREDTSDLYGFLSLDDLDVFEHLLSVSGIGPKSALGILNSVDSDTLREAVSREDATYLTKISGIGKKTAEKIVLELKGKSSMQHKQTTDGSSTGLPNKNDSGILVIDALISLGYSSQDVRSIMKDVDKTASTQDQIKQAMKLLSNI